MPLPKPGILDIRAYQPGASKAPGVERALKLSANENPLGCSPVARAAYLEASDELHLYPDARTSRLRAAVAEKHGLAPERLVFGAGSDEIFSMVAQAYLDRGDNMVQPQYGFAAWAIAARAVGAEVRSAPERDYVVDLDALLAAVDDRTRVVFIANPANPTGTCLPVSEIVRFHALLPTRVLLVLDCAYAEAVGESAGYEDGFDWARDLPNVVITRTFSKMYGLASLRVGWAHAPVEVADALDRIRLPFSISRAGEAAAVAALADEDFVRRSTALVVAERARLAVALAELGRRVLPSAANFVTAHFGDEAEQVVATLARGGVLVRHLRGYGMPEWIRFSVGTPETTQRVIEALREIVV